MIRPSLALFSPKGRRASLTIFTFHRTTPETDPLFPDELDARQFDEILSWLKGWFNVLPLCEATEQLRRGCLPSRAACITFDDGYADNCTHALPILLNHDIHATFFIATGMLNGGRMWNDSVIEAIRGTPHELLDLSSFGLGVFSTLTAEDKRKAISKLIIPLKYLDSIARNDAVDAISDVCGTALPDTLMMTDDQVLRLHSSGMGVGAHTVNHPILARCNEKTARREIADSRDYLEGLTGERIGLFAYPNGKLGSDYTPRDAEIVANLGFDAAVSTNPGASRYGDDLFQIRRYMSWYCGQWQFGLRILQNTLKGHAFW